MASVLLGQRYALRRSGADDADVIAVGVNTYDRMRGDTWLGSAGTAIHCIDTTVEPSPLERLFRGDARETYVVKSLDPRCAAIEAAQLDLLERAISAHSGEGRSP